MLSRGLIGLSAIVCADLALAGVINTRSYNNPGDACTVEGTYVCVSDTTFQQCRFGAWSQVGSVDDGTTCDFHEQRGWQASALKPEDVSGNPSKRSSDIHQDIENELQRRGMAPIADEPQVELSTCPSSKAKRALDVPLIATCGPRGDAGGTYGFYTSSDIRRAYQLGCRSYRYGIYNYPKRFYNREGINVHGCTGDLWEFPVFGGYTFGDPRPGTRAESQNPGGERVIFDRCCNLCAITYHPNPHPDDSVASCVHG